MKASELLKQLSEALIEHGDLEICFYDNEENVELSLSAVEKNVLENLANGVEETVIMLSLDTMEEDDENGIDEEEEPAEDNVIDGESTEGETVEQSTAIVDANLVGKGIESGVNRPLQPGERVGDLVGWGQV
jgi:hypothetical protein